MRTYIPELNKMDKNISVYISIYQYISKRKEKEVNKYTFKRKMAQITVHFRHM